MMKIIKGAAVIAILAVVAVTALYLYFMKSYPKMEPVKDIAVEPTPERLARGYYLANHVTVCMDCHSQRDWDFYSGPPVAGSEGQGGEYFGPEAGFPGKFYSTNLTPYNISDWTDGELMRAITDGIGRDGRALFPIMPYTEYRNLSEEDLLSIIVYLRSLNPIQNEVPERSLDFPMNLIVRTIPEPAELRPVVDSTNTVAYGKYLTDIGGCYFCHTNEENGQKFEGMDFAGGMEFILPGGIVRAANITPHNQTGIGVWDKEMFIRLFRSYQPENIRQNVLERNDPNTIMPWAMYSGMTDGDLGAIYDYLRTVSPVDNEVLKFD